MADWRIRPIAAPGSNGGMRIGASGATTGKRGEGFFQPPGHINVWAEFVLTGKREE